MRREKGGVRIFGKGKCNLIANFSATMVMSLPSLSLSLSQSHLTPYYRKRGSASYIVREVTFGERERERERERYRERERERKTEVTSPLSRENWR